MKQELNQEQFINIIKHLKSKKYKIISSGISSLDIFFESYKNIRLSIHDDKNINIFCNKNSITDIKDNIEFLEKNRFSIKKKRNKTFRFKKL